MNIGLIVQGLGYALITFIALNTTKTKMEGNTQIKILEN